MKYLFKQFINVLIDPYGFDYHIKVIHRYQTMLKLHIDKHIKEMQYGQNKGG